MAINYYEAPLSLIISRRLQRNHSGGTLANWPPQNALMRRPPTRGQYNSRTRFHKLPKEGKSQSMSSPAPTISQKVKPAGVGRFNFVRGV